MAPKLVILGDMNKKLVLPFLLALSQIIYNVHTSKFPEEKANQVFETYSLGISKFFILVVPYIFKANVGDNKEKLLQRKKALHYFLLFLFYVINILLIYGASFLNQEFDEGSEGSKNPSAAGEFAKQGIEMIFLALISIYLLKYKYFIHNYIAIGAFILFGLISDIVLGLYKNIPTIGYPSFILSCVALISDAVFMCYQKYMMEKLYYPYWNIVLVPGIILFSLCTLMLIFILIIGRNTEITLAKGFYEYFDEIPPAIIAGKFLINIILNFCLSTFSILTLFHFFPDYVLISVSLSKFVNYLLDNKTDKYYFIVFFILQFICLLFYLEIFELNFCKLNKNTRRNIQNRGDDDFLGNNESDSQRTSLVEVSPGYLMRGVKKAEDINKMTEIVDNNLYADAD